MTSRSTTTKFLALVLVIILCTGLSACQIIHAAEQPVVAPVDDGVFDNDDLFAVMDEAESLLQNGSYIIESPSEYVQYFFNENEQILVNCFERKDTSIIISYSADRADRQTVLTYGIFLHLICSRYPDAVCKADYKYIPGKTNRTFSAYVFFYPGYKQDGFETPLDACKHIAKAIENSKDNAFYIHMGDNFRILERRKDYGTLIYNYDFDGYERYMDNIGQP